MIDIEFFRVQQQRGDTPKSHREPSVGPLRSKPEQFTLQQYILNYSIYVWWPALGISLRTAVGRFWEISLRTEEVRWMHTTDTMAIMTLVIVIEFT